MLGRGAVDMGRGRIRGGGFVRHAGRILLLALVAFALLVVMPVMSRRLSVEARVDADCEDPVQSVMTVMGEGRADVRPIVPDGLPPVSWRLIMSDEERANASAVEDDIMTGEAFSESSLPLLWPTLPYSVPTSDDLEKLVNEVCEDFPVLSVMTDGQSSCPLPVFGHYRILHDGDASGDGDRQGEMGEVIEAVDDIVDAVDGEFENIKNRDLFQTLVPMYPHDDGYLYATCAELEIAKRVAYSDGIDDTRHSNDIYGALVEGESKCYGMACAIKAVLDRRGIPSFVASGCLGDPRLRHAVTCLWVDGGWHVCDMTGLMGKSIPDRLEWRNVPMPIPLGSGSAGSVMMHDLHGPLGGVVMPLGKYEREQGFMMDSRCVCLMEAYEEAIGAASAS